MEDEAGAARLLISEMEVEEVRIAERRIPGQDNQGAPMETDSEGRASMVMATAAATSFGEALAVERRDTVLIAGVERRCNVFPSVALWPTEANAALGGVMQSSLATPMEADREAVSAEAEVTCEAEMGRQLGGNIFDIGDEGSLLESVLREKLLKSMRSKLLVPETTSRVPERGLCTSTDNWTENDVGATRQLISAAAVEEEHETEGRVPDNHGEPMETESEERGQAGSCTLVGAGGRPKPVNWSEMSKTQQRNWRKRHGDEQAA
jgi:hypothetical protein